MDRKDQGNLNYFPEDMNAITQKEEETELQHTYTSFKPPFDGTESEGCLFRPRISSKFKQQHSHNRRHILWNSGFRPPDGVLSF